MVDGLVRSCRWQPRMSWRGGGQGKAWGRPPTAAVCDESGRAAETDIWSCVQTSSLSSCLSSSSSIHPPCASPRYEHSAVLDTYAGRTREAASYPPLSSPLHSVPSAAPLPLSSGSSSSSSTLRWLYSSASWIPLSRRRRSRLSSSSLVSAHLLASRPRIVALLCCSVADAELGPSPSLPCLRLQGGFVACSAAPPTASSRTSR